MSDKISFFSNDDIEQHLGIVLSQTAYTREEAINKLQMHNGDYMKVIREFMGIPEKKQESKVKSLNQEIYKQIRHKLDSSMQEYRNNNPIDLNHVVECFAESEEKLKQIKTGNN